MDEVRSQLSNVKLESSDVSNGNPNEINISDKSGSIDPKTSSNLANSGNSRYKSKDSNSNVYSGGLVSENYDEQKLANKFIKTEKADIGGGIVDLRNTDRIKHTNDIPSNDKRGIDCSTNDISSNKEHRIKETHDGLIKQDIKCSNESKLKASSVSKSEITETATQKSNISKLTTDDIATKHLQKPLDDLDDCIAAEDLDFVMDHYSLPEITEEKVVKKSGGRLWVGNQCEEVLDGEREEEEVVGLTVDLAHELGDVGRYSYAGFISHSLFVLFEYAPCHRKYQEDLVKRLLEHLNLSKQLEGTMLLLTGGEIDMETCDPFATALKKDAVVQKEGPHCLPYDLVSVAVRDGLYDARTRSIAKLMCLKFGISKRMFEAVEDLVLKIFIEEQHEMTEEEQKEKEQRAKKRKIKRAAIIGAAAVGGGVLIGLTGGLAAPLIAAGVGAAVGTGGVILGSVAGVAIMGSLFGVAGAGLTGYKMSKRVGDLEEFEFEPLTTGHSLHVTIVISGWLTAKHNDFKEAWYGVANSNEQYALRFESRYLKPLGDALEYIIHAAVSAAVKEGLKHTVLAGLMAAITWPMALISVASIIDNPWSICTQRSVNTGRQLAEVLLSRQQGKRPVTLIGYSFGARVIFACLQEMSKRKNSEGIIEEAIMLGAPVTASPQDWSAFSRVVSGRIVNGYCGSDWLLKFMYRTASVQFSIAGLCPIEWKHRLMHNVDLSEVVTGHTDYFHKMDEILNFVGVATKDHVPLGTADSLKQLSALQKKEYNRMSQANAKDSPNLGNSKKNPSS